MYAWQLQGGKVCRQVGWYRQVGRQDSRYKVGRQVGSQVGRQIDRQGQVGRQVGRQVGGRKVGKQVGRQVGRQVDRQINKQNLEPWVLKLCLPNQEPPFFNSPPPSSTVQTYPFLEAYPPTLLQYTLDTHRYCSTMHTEPGQNLGQEIINKMDMVIKWK